ncbi:hypothetical protein OTK49_02250 [Vibrio coralliirubri]|uniref:hypothetical protein n=1 Tax=Vibrio coralliirubri TaxID=1516159 RepID=UPI002284E4C5|nr:hypothetical protein [Vibrio coralliirubri]MCY9861337.1 hypothetical protein [Vibrio coralliirubri]
MTLEQLRIYANTAKKAADNISTASPDEVTALFTCPDLLLAAIKKIEATQSELSTLVDR